MTNPEPLTLQPPPAETVAEARERRKRSSGDALRDAGLEAPVSKNGVVTHNATTEALCARAGVEYRRTPAGRLWVAAWAVAVLSTLKGTRSELKVRVLKHYVNGPEKERAALLTVWRTRNMEALTAMVNPASWTKGAMRREARNEERRRRAEQQRAERNP